MTVLISERDYVGLIPIRILASSNVGICSITTKNMRTILYTTGTINCESGVDHRWRIKTLHDSIGEATVIGNYSMSLDNCPADGYVIVAIEDCNHIVQSLLPGNVSFLPELGAFK